MASAEPDFTSDHWCHRHSHSTVACALNGHPECEEHGGELEWANPNYGMPDSPFGPVDQAAIEFFGVYEANVRAGFTAAQSMYLLATQMTGNPGIAPGLDLPEPPTPVN